MRSVAIAALLPWLAAPGALRAAAPAGAATRPAVPEIAGRTVAEGGVVVAVLDNGLTVIVKPMRIAPVVCVRCYVRAGSLYEKEFLGCGISHLCEHLVAKGALHEGPGQAAKAETRSAVSDIGGQSNASTSMAWTQYYISAAAGKALDCVDLIAGWMSKAEIADEDFRREHGVVQRELELGRDEPRRQMWAAHAADVFGTHPASVPIIGFAQPLAHLTADDVRTYHRRMYTPRNMVFVVVGDVDVEEVLERTRRAFAGTGPGRVPDLSLPEVRPLGGVVRSAHANKELKEVMAEISFQTVPLVHPDLYPLDVLSTILAQGESSRLVAKVRRKLALVTSISCSSWTPHWGRGVFNVSYRAEPDKADAAEKAVLDELRNVLADGVTEDELARAKRQMVASHVHAQQSVESVSATLGADYLTAGDVSFSANYTRRVRSVTGEQVREAARKHLRFDRMAVTRLVPPDRLAAAGASAKAGPQHKAVTFTLDNGLRVVLMPTDAVELAAMTLATRGGLLVETRATNGLGNLMADLSTQGTERMSAEQIAEFFARAGGGISGSCGNNTFYWEASALSDSFDEALAIFADVVTKPAFPQKELEILRPMELSRIDRIQESWSSELQQFYRREFFGETPYGMLPIGRKEVVEAATAKQVADYHRRHVRAGESVLAVCGQFDPVQAEKTIRRQFAAMPPGKAEIELPARRTVPPAGETHVLKTSKQQVAGVIVAAPGMTVDNLEDRFAIDVLDTILSGYRLPGGWLHNELRGKQLVYVVHAYNWAGLAPGAFLVYAAGQPEKAPQVVSIIHRNLRKAAEYTPTREEIDRAVNTILTADLLGNQSMGASAMSAALDEMYGFGYDFRGKLEAHYAKVTPADVARVAKKYLGGGYVTCVATPKPELVEKGK